MGWEGHVAHMTDEKLWLENLRGKNHLEDFVVDGSIILKWV
jgi:hypothetical protein